jgi:hypothetical protein
MKKTLLYSCVFALLAQTADAASCASLSEKRSLEMRALQSELMVAALACGKKPEYNQYVNLFASDLQWQGKQLRDYFQRLYGKQSDRALNQFVTQMANQASRLSLTLKSAEYCNQATQLFKKINTSLPWQVVDYARIQYASWHSVQSCDATQVIATAQ